MYGLENWQGGPDCTHPRIDAIADTGEWICKDCGALMCVDTNPPEGIA